MEHLANCHVWAIWQRLHLANGRIAGENRRRAPGVYVGASDAPTNVGLFGDVLRPMTKHESGLRSATACHGDGRKGLGPGGSGEQQYRQREFQRASPDMGWVDRQNLLDQGS